MWRSLPGLILRRPTTIAVLIYWRMGRLERAMRNFDTAIRLRPDLAVGHYNRAVVRRPDGRRCAMRPWPTWTGPDCAFARRSGFPGHARSAGRDGQGAEQAPDVRRAGTDPALCGRLATDPDLAALE